ncbi:MAG: DUF937 domain-containing protein [Rhodobacteraceae bacterium]|nr:DUF937 domain-containing protein [Paracoccaceae bacterium]
MSILSMISSRVTPDMVDQIATKLGTQNTLVEKALNGAVPGLLAALLGAAKTTGRKESFAQVLAAQDPSMPDALSEQFGQNADTVADHGREALSPVLGDAPLAAFTSEVQRVSGVPSGAASALTGLAGSLVMGALGKASQRDGLDAGGVLSMLQGEAGDIAKALPIDFAESFRGAGFLEALDEQLATAPASVTETSTGEPPPPPRPARVPVKPGRPWWQTALVGLVVLGLLGWLLGLFEGNDATQVTDTGSAPLVVDGTDVGAQLQTEMAGLQTTLASITDVATAEQALPALTAALETFNAVAFSAEDLPADGKAALQSTVAGALPALRDAADGLLSNGAIANVVGPILQQILDRLQGLA